MTGTNAEESKTIANQNVGQRQSANPGIALANLGTQLRRNNSHRQPQQKRAS
jgi:hypothetical protein